jgi:signal transduction histidine kinase/DNA-binding response OmpR family regulator/ligand-binding sensor domain-containing protein
LEQILKCAIIKNLIIPTLKISKINFLYLVVLSMLINTYSFEALYQNLKFEKFSLPEGFPSNRIFSMKQDRLGFIWFGTQDGLVRYDGYTFKIFQPDTTRTDYRIVYIEEDGSMNLWIATWENGLFKYERKSGQFIHFTYDPLDSTTISSNKINNSFLDSKDQLWLIHVDSLICKLDTKSGKVQRFYHDPSDTNSISCNRASNNGFIVKWAAICEDSLGNVWIGTQNGLDRFNRHDNNFSRFLYNPFDSSTFHENWCRHILADRQNNIWVGTDSGGVVCFNPRSNTAVRYKHNPKDKNSIWENHCPHLFLDSRNKIWVTNYRSFECLDPATGYFTHYENDVYQDSPKPIYECYPYYEDEQGAIWYQAVTSQEFGIINPTTGEVLHLLRDSNNPDGIGPLYLTAFCKDFSEIMWLGSYWVGLNKLDLYKTQFSNLRHEANNPKTLHNNDAWPFFQSRKDSNIVWIGGIGLSTFNLRTKEFSQLDVGLSGLSQLDQRFHAVCEDSNGVIWASNLNDVGGLYRIENKVVKIYYHNPQKPSSLPTPLINSMAADPDGSLWLGTIGKGLVHFDPESEIFTTYGYIPDDSMTICGGQINFLYFDRSNDLWACSQMGLSRWIPETRSFQRYLVNQDIREVFEDSFGNFWVGLAFNGLYLFDKRKGQVLEYFNHKKYFPFKAGSERFQQDKNGDLWMSLGGCLAKLEIPQKKFTFFYKEHGLPGTGFVKNVKLRDGQMCIGVPGHGLILFDPTRIKLNSIPPKLVLTDFKLFNESLKVGAESPLKENITVAKRVELAHWQNDISIEMTALHFGIPTKNEYKYYLENYDNDWRFNGAGRIANYTNLDPGEYIFHFKGANADGFWNEEPVSLRIIIHPPWWATIWAYMLYGVLFVWLVVFTWKLQLRRIRLRNDLKMREFEAEQLKKIDHLKSQFFANISHEFRTPITLVLGPLEKLLNKTNDSEDKKDLSIMRRNINRLHRLINQLLDISALEAGKLVLNRTSVDVARLVRHFVQSFESQAGLKHIRLDFNSDAPTLYASVDKNKIEDIIYNLLSNALKFTKAGGQISVLITSLHQGVVDTPSMFEIKVSDTGIGIAPDRLPHIFDRFYQVDDSYVRETEGSGIGLSLTKELVELHGGKISVDSAPGVGSVFTVRLPIGQIEEGMITETTEPSPFVEESVTDVADVPTAKSKGKPIVLIVEDNSDLRTYMRDVMHGKFQLREAPDGQTGFDLAKKIVPDLIISDVMMPKMDGYQLCKKLKLDEITAHIPVILLTARASKDSKLEGLETGADDYLIKPFDAEELIVRVNNLVNQRRRLREQFARKISIDPMDMAVTSADEQFVLKAYKIIEAHLSDSEFGAESFAKNMAVSRTVLHRKLRGITGQSATEFIRSIRLKRAAQLIKQNSGTITEIAYDVGFNNLSYFAECFKKQFGVNPRNYK